MVAEYRSNSTEKRYKSLKYKDVEKKVNALSRHEAFVLFENAKKRLNDINNWQLLCGNSPAEFQLTDNMGNLLNSPVPQVGNLIKVRCQAPANGHNTYIWYKITAFIHEKNLLKDTEDFGFSTQQILDPFVTGGDSISTGLTCTFLVTRSDCRVSAVEFERTKVLIDDSIPVFVKLKERFNTVFSLISSPNHQWKSLMNGVLHY